MQKHESHAHNDEINIREIWSILVKRKLTIFISTAIAAFFATFYAETAIPIYSGEALIEIGEVVNTSEGKETGSSTTIFYLDNINTIKEITLEISKLKVEIPNGLPNMLRITAEGPDKSKITSQLESIVQFIIQRHTAKAELYKNSHIKIKMTEMVGKINVSDYPTKPKKQSIITASVIGGLMFGIFLAFFLEFISSNPRKEQ